MLPFSVKDITVNKPFLRNFIKFYMNSEIAYSQACTCMVCNAILTKDDIQYNADTAVNSSATAPVFNVEW
jgi:hypothetical protein